MMNSRVIFSTLGLFTLAYYYLSSVVSSSVPGSTALASQFESFLAGDTPLGTESEERVIADDNRFYKVSPQYLQDNKIQYADSNTLQKYLFQQRKDNLRHSLSIYNDLSRLPFQDNGTSIDTLLEEVQAIAHLPTKHTALLRVARIALSRGNPDDALAILNLDRDEMLRVGISDTPVSLLVRGYCYSMKGDYNEALFCFESAIGITNNRELLDVLEQQVKNTKKKQALQVIPV